jgi:chromosome segregation ATPase
MEQLEELQGRIQTALHRIYGGVAALEQKHANRPVPTLEELDMQKHAELLADLEDERMANAQLEERLKLLHGRLEDMEKKVAAVDGAEDMIALHAELELLRNASGNPVEVDALKAEVARLKQDLEVARNQAASEHEKLEDDLTEATAQNEALQAQIDELSAGAGAELAPAVDTAALDAELDTLRIELEATRARAEAAEAASGADAPVDEGVSAELDQRLGELDGELQNLRASNDQLRQSNAALRAANAEGVGDPTLINAGLEAEVEGLKAARATDQAEVNAVLARLEPLLATAPNLPEGEEA